MKNKQDFKVHYELLKAIAEYNRERMFQYDVEKDVAVHFAVKNGEFTEDVVFENYGIAIYGTLCKNAEKSRKKGRKMRLLFMKIMIIMVLLQK